MKPDADDRDVTGRFPCGWLSTAEQLVLDLFFLWLQHGNEQTEKTEPVMRLCIRALPWFYSQYWRVLVHF
jgi:hypothetical protein